MKYTLMAVLVASIAVLSGGAEVALAQDKAGEGPPAASFAPAPAVASPGGNVLTFRIDSHPELDFYQPCNGGDRLIAFPINVQGVDPTTATSARLTMAVWDVDYDCGWYCCERDTVYVNGHRLTTPQSFLTGANNQWSTVSFDVPPAWLVQGNNNIRILIDTLGCYAWCVSCNWAELTLELKPPPEIEEIEILKKCWLIFYCEEENPTTTKDVILRAKLKNMDGYEVVKLVWTGDLVLGSAEGNPCTVKPPAGSHGRNKRVTAALTYRNVSTSQISTVTKSRDGIELFFDKDGDDDKDKEPNWFDYWPKDGAVPGMVGFGYNSKIGYGQFAPPSTLQVGPSAGGEHYTTTVLGIRFGGYTIGGIFFGGATGIDCAAEVCGHERYHKLIYDNNQSPPWNDQANHHDTDELIDDYETGTSHTLIDNPDTHNVAGIRRHPKYARYGDQEWMAMRTGNGLTGIVGKDWAHPGKRTVSAGAAAQGSSNSLRVTPALSGYAALFTPLAGTGFTGTFSDHGTDENGNLLYDYLTVTADVTVQNTGLYNLVGWLETNAGEEVGLVNQPAYLEAGVHTCAFDFDGLAVHQAGRDGPFNLSLILADPDGGEYDSLMNAYTTSPYTVNQFEGHQAYLGGQITDEAQDTDADGLYEQLAFNVKVVVTIPGSYSLSSFLTHSNGAPICHMSASDTLQVGTHTLTLTAPSTAIRQMRLNGPYKLMYLEILDGEGQTDFRYDAYTTTDYAYTDFEGGAAEFGNAASFHDHGVDLNGNGLFDVLRLTLPTSVSQAGKYALLGRLFDGEDNLICEWFSEPQLTTGINNLTLDFPGKDIRIHSKSGPYSVRYAFLYDPEGSVADSLPSPHATAAYNYRQFEAVAVALTGDFDDRSIDLNADGRYEYLDVDVGVFVAASGSYALNGRLMDTNGQEIVWAATTANVPPGSPQMLTLRFDGPAIYAHGVNGPYLLRDVHFYKVNDPSKFDRIYDAYTTKSAWRVVANEPPVAEAGPDQVVEATGPAGALVTLDASASTDPDSTPGTNDDIVSFEWTENAVVIASGEQAQVSLSLGTHNLTLRVTDSAGEQAEDAVQVTVRDTTPPSVGSIGASPSVLWPPNHAMVPVTVSVTTSDICDPNPVSRILNVTCNEPVNSGGDGNTDPDTTIVGDLALLLRAERSGTGTGRVYTITVECRDASGNAATAQTRVTVPHDQR